MKSAMSRVCDVVAASVGVRRERLPAKRSPIVLIRADESCSFHFVNARPFLAFRESREAMSTRASL